VDSRKRGGVASADRRQPKAENMKISFTIPGPPEGKRRPRSSTRHGIARIHSDPADVKREKLIRSVVRDAMQNRPAMTGAVRVTIEATFEVAPSWTKAKKAAALDGVYHTIKPDADNIAKSILDGLNPDSKAKNECDREPFCLVDDGQVAEQLIRKRYGDYARTVVIVETIKAEGLL
jgi:Holliday junction resolvase RusA-like endonuclease